MTNDTYRSFISKIDLFQEDDKRHIVKVWVVTRPSWLPSGQYLYFNTSKFNRDFIKGLYYYPGFFTFYVSNTTYEIENMAYFVHEEKRKCVIL